MTYLDTHVVIWLHANHKNAFPRRARKILDALNLFISSAVYLETQYLFEAGKIRVQAAEIFLDLERQIDLKLSATSFAVVARKAAGLTWAHDPFDRLIVAEAEIAGTPLLTRDNEIRKHCKLAVWD